jgi:choline monooxygenase
VWDSFLATQGARMGPEPGPFPGVPAGSSVADVVADRIRAHHAAGGVDLSRFDTRTMLRLSQYNLFPNTTVLVTPDLLSVLTSRPGPTADRAELVMFHFTRAASPDSARTVPVDVDVPVGAASFGAVLDADVEVLAGMQRGLRQPGLDEIVLAREECRIVNMHRNLERTLGLEPGGRLT